MSARKYQTPEIMHDAPLHDHKSADFHFDDFAATLARLVASPKTETPLVIGINGAWGSGKTSLLLRVKNMLDFPKGKGGKESHRFAQEEEKDFRACKTVWFDAWKYNDEKELLVALVRVILHAMKRDGFINKLKAWDQDPTQPTYDLLGMFLNSFQASFGGLGAEFKFQVDPKKHETPSKFEEYTAFFDYFSEAFERLLAAWVHDKAAYDEIDEGKGALVIFIDDLDRCLPEKIVQTLEALKLFLDKRGCAFFIGADTAIVQRAVSKHYEDAGITGESAKDYLEKVIQLRFDLPMILDAAMEQYLRTQAQVDPAMLSRWRALVAAAEVNPRRVKNVINDLNLQWVMAVNSGQAEGVDRDDFICWQALMHAAPAAFTRQVLDFEDKSIRFGFLQDALKWQNGKQEDREAVKGFFSAYEDKDSKRLRNVLRQISFSDDFTEETLDAIIYLVAPPPKPAVLENDDVDKKAHAGLETPPTWLTQETLESLTQASTAFEAVSKGNVAEFHGTIARGDKNRENLPQDDNHLIIGGVEFVRIPKGRFIMGSKEDNNLALDSERPQHTVDISYDYWMAKFILTNAQFAEFLDKKKHPVSDWQKRKAHPVVNVSWDDAAAYCIWFNEIYQAELTAAGGLTLHLPSEAEWEKAARGAYGNEWPWGNEFDPNKCNSAEGKQGGTTPVGAYSAMGGDSPYGCTDMVGNVWEWTSTLFAKYPYLVGDGREDTANLGRRVLRGASFNLNQDYARSACRGHYSLGFRNSDLGFRVCLSFSSHV